MDPPSHSSIEVSAIRIDSFLHTADIDHDSKLFSVSHNIQFAPVTLRPAPTEEEYLFSSSPVIPTSVIQHAPPEEPSSHDPRLVIHKMILINLKSYAGGQDFTRYERTSFSSIVGPKGVGKSNMIGELLFVFGCRASSKMRQGTLSELIHSPVRYLDSHECGGEVQFRAVIDLSRVQVTQLHPARIRWKAKLDQRGAGVAEAGERACEGSRVSPDCGSTICAKCLETHEQFGAQIEYLEKEHYKERERPYEELKAAAKETTTDQSAREKQSVGLEER
ncbi:hypothetical protein K503DRAFT_800958 [Rhizopogon vinicolor AM-OR11-026]|uniref:RecF/RecN/SMC N-terminal domain-containing protein n=1 Tax=Rhizopogon vinicolor AM-OR11-026 TaxID=1314800 RepID=A0A1B7MYW3_9AGAM|nr:hypothetical protein K503DRAFT_800958 [Rhizopogon vinicolor AM-OR11-026]